MSFGTTSQIINASRVLIERAGTEVTLTSDLTVRISRQVDRINTRAGAIDTFRWRLEEIEFTAALTELLLTQVQTDSGISTESAMTYNNWTVTGLSISGQAADNTNDTFSATLLDYEQIAPENGLAQLRIRLRVAAGAN